MTTTVQSIIERAQIVLQDQDGVRWPATELVQHLNDAQRAYLEKRPDQKTETTDVVLVAGFRQLVPATAASLIDIHNNTAGRMRRITKVDPDQLDAVLPSWRSATPSAEVVHFMHDLREPRVFWVYPPAAASASVSMTRALYPVDAPVPGGPVWSTATGNLDLPDHAADAVLNFVLFKAYSKDAEFGGNSQLAAGYLALFNAAVGSQLQSTAQVAPKT